MKKLIGIFALLCLVAVAEAGHCTVVFRARIFFGPSSYTGESIHARVFSEYLGTTTVDVISDGANTTKIVNIAVYSSWATDASFSGPQITDAPYEVGPATTLHTFDDSSPSVTAPLSGSYDINFTEANAGAYITVDLYTSGYVDTDSDGIPDYLDTDSNGDGLPDMLATLPPAAATIYYAAGGDKLTLLGSNATVSASTPRACAVEAWPDRSALAAVRINENSRNITWHCILYDKRREPYRDNAGNIVVFTIVPEWRRQSEDYGEGE